MKHLVVLLYPLLGTVRGNTNVRRIVPVEDASCGTPKVRLRTCCSEALFPHVKFLRQFVGEWEPLVDYPIYLGEAQGGMIGSDLVVTGGFRQGLASVAVDTYAMSTTGDGSWRRMDDFPIAEGITHAAFAIHETKMYLCGGYIGAHPGRSADDCFVYDHSVAPGQGKQWSRLPSLPSPRGGGGMNYDSRYQVLVFAGGATRPVAGVADAIDHDTTWLLAPGTPEYGWHKQKSFPMLGNHLSFVDAVDVKGDHHMMYVGGQISEEENDGNLDELYEYEALDDRWITRANMPFPRGHASASTLAYGCGFLMAGGAVNGNGARKRTNDVSYYDIATNTWTHVGLMYMEIKTPICGIHDDYMYCTSGYTRRTYRRKLGMDPLTQ